MVSAERFVHDLVAAVPELRPVYDEHIAENDTLLPHVVMADIARFAVEKAADPRFRRTLQTLLAQLDKGLGSGDGSIAELIGASFIENLLGEDITELRKLMTPILIECLESMSNS